MNNFYTNESRTAEITRYVRTASYETMRVSDASYVTIFDEALDEMNEEEILAIARDFIDPEALRQFVLTECTENGYASEFGQAYVDSVLEERSDEEEARASRYW